MCNLHREVFLLGKNLHKTKVTINSPARATMCDAGNSESAHASPTVSEHCTPPF